MGSTNHGTQSITHEYYESATAEEFNKRHLNIRPRGVYKGGYLTKVSNTEVTLSTFTVEIGDDDIQISVQTAASVTLNSTTLDSGDIDSSTPYIVLRWGYLAEQNNYVEIHAIASTATAQDNDIIIGKCNFTGSTLTGFDYSDRTFLNVQDIFFKVEESSGLYVQLRAGRMRTSSGCEVVPEQKVGPFTVPGSPNSRIDLVYIDSNGDVQIEEGTAAVSPSTPDFGDKLVVATVRLVNGDTSIPASRITDVRSFLTAPAEEVTQVGWTYSGATIHSGTVTTSWAQLDLTSIVGTGRSLLLIRAQSSSSNRGLQVKPDDESNSLYEASYNWDGCEKVWDKGLLIVHTNNGKVDIRTKSYSATWTLVLVGYTNFIA